MNYSALAMPRVEFRASSRRLREEAALSAPGLVLDPKAIAAGYPRSKQEFFLTHDQTPNRMLCHAMQ